MKVIVHPEKYGYFVGWRERIKYGILFFDAVWQKNVTKAIKAFREYLLTHPSTDVEKEFKLLSARKVFKNQISIEEV